MGRVKKFLLYMFTFVCVFSMSFSSFGENYVFADDEPSAWANEAVESAYENNYLFYGMKNGYQKPVTREEFCVIAVCFLNYVFGHTTYFNSLDQQEMDINFTLDELGLKIDQNVFKDTNNPYVLAAHALKITRGTGKNLFSPKTNITREQAATMIARVAQIMGIKDEQVQVNYEDFDKTSQWAKNAVNFCLNQEIMKGTAASKIVFNPKQTYTKEQSLVTFYNLDKLFKMGKGEILYAKDMYAAGDDYPQRWASVSPIQQFSYKKQGLAYAYIPVKDDDTLSDEIYITTPEKKLKIQIKYPILGDIIADETGNFYIVWGRNNKNKEENFETTFISKYDENGKHIKTTGFVGESTPFGSSYESMTQAPFDCNRVTTVIKDGILVNYHGKTRIDGHQSDQVIAVYTEDMREYKMPNTTFTGHSFNQSLIYSEKLKDFLFASHGDAYARGFRVNDKDGGYGDESQNIFHFYLEPNANYSMYIVNETFAQLGGLAEIDDYVVFVGASAKSLGEEAKKEKQNLFIQIFDPTFKNVSPSMFKGGETRRGITSFNIYDNGSGEMKEVSDYGVKWLTNYTDRHVISPQVVKAGNKIVILWSTTKVDGGDVEEKNEAFYMVLDMNGDVIKQPTSLGKQALNASEAPVYHKGTLNWISVWNQRLKQHSVAID